MVRLIFLLLMVFCISSASYANQVIREENDRIIVEYEGTGGGAPESKTKTEVNPSEEYKAKLQDAIEQIAKILTFYETDPKSELQYKLSQVESLLPNRDYNFSQLEIFCKEQGNCERSYINETYNRINKQNEAISYLRIFAVNAESISIDDLKLYIVESNKYGTDFSYKFKVSNSGYPAEIGFKLIGLDRNKFIIVERLTDTTFVPQNEYKIVYGKNYESTETFNRVYEWMVKVNSLQRFNKATK
jgi:hypothetical protein